MSKFFIKLSAVVVCSGGLYSAIYYSRQALVPWYAGKEDLTGKTVLITGATSGIGRATAKQLAARNAKVILGCRDQDKCIWVRREIVEKTKNEQVFCSVIELGSLKSIKAFVERMKQKDIHFNILINNAGVMRCAKKYTEEGFELQLGVNHLGHFYLTNLLLDDLKKHTPAKIINVTSEAHKKADINFDDLNGAKNFDATNAYNQSKLANILFTKELAERLKSTGVYVYAADPGVCNTRLNRYMKHERGILGKIFVRPFLKLFGRNPENGCQVILHCAISPDLENDEASGKLYRDNQVFEPSEKARDASTAKKLWLVSDRWTLNRDKPSGNASQLSSEKVIDHDQSHSV